MTQDAAPAAPEAATPAQPEPAANTGDARLPDLTPWLPACDAWLYLVPAILLLLFWLFCPLALILIVCVILLLGWWLA